MSIAMSNSAPAHSDYFTSGQHFLETFTLLPETIQKHKLMVTSTSISSTSNMTLLHTANITPRTSNNTRCYLNSLITPFRLFTSFFSHEACSTNPNSIFHAAIKNYPKTLHLCTQQNLVRKQLNVNTHTHVTTFPR